MNHVRAIEIVRGAVRICALFGVIAWAAASWLASLGERKDLVARALWLRRTCSRILAVLRVRVRSLGAPPEGGLILAANHLGYLDILVIGAAAPTVFVAKREVRDWPVFGWLAARAGTRFIDRERARDVTRVAEELNEAVQAGLAVAIFLEGTSTDGSEVACFKSSLLEPAVAAGWRVAPAALHYAVPAGRSAALEVCWWGDMALAPHLANLATLPWVEARVGWGEPAVARGHRKQVAETLRARVAELKGQIEKF